MDSPKFKISGFTKPNVEPEPSTKSNEGKLFNPETDPVEAEYLGYTFPSDEVQTISLPSFKDRLTVILKQVEVADGIEEKVKLIGKLKGALELLS